MSKSIWSGLFWGLLVGGAVALLLAPQSGQVTREMLASKSRQAKRRASEMATGATQKAQFMSEKIKQAI